MTSQAAAAQPMTSEQISARISEIGETLSYSLCPDLALPNYRELIEERERLRVELRAAYVRESNEATAAAAAAEREAFGPEEFDRLGRDVRAAIDAIEKKARPALAALDEFDAMRAKHGGALVDKLVPPDYLVRLQRLRLLRALLRENETR